MSRTRIERSGSTSAGSASPVLTASECQVLPDFVEAWVSFMARSRLTPLHSCSSHQALTPGQGPIVLCSTLARISGQQRRRKRWPSFSATARGKRPAGSQSRSLVPLRLLQDLVVRLKSVHKPSRYGLLWHRGNLGVCACLHACVRACVRGWVGVCVCVWVGACVRGWVGVCVCVCGWVGGWVGGWVWVGGCVCVCGCVRACVCVCVALFLRGFCCPLEFGVGRHLPA